MARKHSHLNSIGVDDQPVHHTAGFSRRLLVGRLDAWHPSDRDPRFTLDALVHGEFRRDLDTPGHRQSHHRHHTGCHRLFRHQRLMEMACDAALENEAPTITPGSAGR